MNYETPALFLEKLALRGSTLSYAGFAQHFGMNVPKPSHWQQSDLGNFIADVTAEDVKLGRPLRSAVLVRAKEQSPGRGFYTAYNHARAANVMSETERLAAWIKERRRAATYPWWTVSGLNVERLQLPAVVQPAGVSWMSVHGH